MKKTLLILTLIVGIISCQKEVSQPAECKGPLVISKGIDTIGVNQYQYLLGLPHYWNSGVPSAQLFPLDTVSVSLSDWNKAKVGYRFCP